MKRQTIFTAAMILLCASLCHAEGATTTKRRAVTASESDAPNVIVLPPHLPLSSTALIRKQACLLCDRLAEEIGKTEKARIINRTQLDRVLKERKLTPGSGKPMLSYDGMIRLHVRADQLVPEAQINLLDLSTGNIVGTWKCVWPVADAELAKVVSKCVAVLPKLIQPSEGKLKVRMMGVASVESQVRMRHLARRLNNVCLQSLRKSPNILLVRHLEASTSKEESLLLLMGLSRLPGGRRFIPQSDATVELRLHEGDAIGKTFKETPVKIGARVRKGIKFAGKWVTVTGKVKNFDRLIQQTWKKLAKDLSEAKPGAAVEFLNEMATRRRQAEAELKAATSETAPKPTLAKYLEKLSHIDAALKIDPTYEPAAYESIYVLARLSGHYPRKYPIDSPTALRLAHEAARYIQQFSHKPKHCARVQDRASVLIVVERRKNPLYRLYKYNERIEITPSIRQKLDAMKRMVEETVDGPFQKLGHSGPRMLLTVYRGMRLAGVPLQRRRRWVDGILAHCREHEKQIHRAGHHFGYLYLNRVTQLQAALVSVEDSEFDRAKRILEHVRANIGKQENNVGGAVTSVIAKMRKIMVQTRDPKTLAKFDQWARYFKNPVRIMSIKWPKLRIFDRRKAPRVKTTLISYKRNAPISALVEGDKSLYILIARDNHVIGRPQFTGGSSRGISQLVAKIPLDDKGCPVGWRTHKPIRGKNWGSVRILPQPKVRKYLQVLCSRYIGGKLYLGTKYSGLLIFDPGTEKWTIVGPKQGLPAWSLNTFFLINKNTLFCTSRVQEPHYIPIHYTLNLTNGKIKLIRKYNPFAPYKQRKYIPHRLEGVWYDGGKLNAWEQFGLWRDLLSSQPKHNRITRKVAYGWRVTGWRGKHVLGMVEVAGRRFIQCHDGFHEFGPDGKIIRSHYNQMSFHPTGTPSGWNNRRLVIPQTCPANGTMFACGNMLFFDNVAYDPKNDTWYGPVFLGGYRYVVGTRSGIWLSSSRGLTYVNAKDFLDTAKKSARVMTTAQWNKRREKKISAQSALNQAKFAFTMRQFKKAKRILSGILKTNGNNAEVLLLMGYLHDKWCMNQPEEAIKYYSQLTKIKNNLPANLSGMYMWFHVLKGQKKWAKALELNEKISKSFSGINNDRLREIRRLSQRMRKKLAEKKAKK